MTSALRTSSEEDLSLRQVGTKRAREDNGPGVQPNWKGRRVDREPQNVIDDAFIQECREAFKEDPKNSIARNVVSMVGTFPVVADSKRAGKVNHVFLNTIKREGVKATNQMQSGRCWLFAGLNMFRHQVIHGLNLKNFEFSQVYLYFWDKWERSGVFLDEMWQYKDVPLENYLSQGLDAVTVDRQQYVKERCEKPLEDGGYWNYFANLVEKYGVVPKTAMEETVISLHSDEMNKALCTKLRQATAKIQANKDRWSDQEYTDFKKEVLAQIYNTLVIFLGEPPKKFDWTFTDAEQKSTRMTNLTPLAFKRIVMPGLDLRKDFVVLANYPVKGWKERQVYEIKEDLNMVGGSTHRMLNVSAHDIQRYMVKAIKDGMPVWFTGDVGRGFHDEKAALDERLIKPDLVFGEPPYRMSKGERFVTKESHGSHAMTFLGFNRNAEEVSELQIENSWGFYDDETPGIDGFLTTYPNWVKENVYEIVVLKQHLSRNLYRLWDDQQAIQLKTFGAAAACDCEGHFKGSQRKAK